jgi:hypothetical protein
VSGYTISDAITYTFPQGFKIPQNQTIMLAKDLTLISGFDQISKYQWTSGSLSNSGEPITFKDVAGNTMDYVYYGTNSPWPVQANGQGYYMKLISTNLDNSLPESWEAISLANPMFKSLAGKSMQQKSVDLSNNSINETKVYPNPMKENLFINLIEKSVVSIYNMAGQIVKVKTFDAGKNILNVSDLAKGGYLVKVQGEKQTRTYKVVKE